MTPAADLAPANWAEESAGEFSDLEVKYAGQLCTVLQRGKKPSKLLSLVDSS